MELLLKCIQLSIILSEVVQVSGVTLFPGNKPGDSLVMVFKKDKTLVRKRRDIFKRDVVTSSCSLPEDYQSKLTSSLSKQFFHNDSNSVLLVLWSGTDGVLLVLSTMDLLMQSNNGPSKLYRSTNREKHFEDISTNLQGETIEKENGFQHHPTYTSLVIFVGFNPFYKEEQSTNLYITKDAGATFTKSVAPFRLSKSFKFNKISKLRLLALSNFVLHFSDDFAVSWTTIAEFVFLADWDPLSSDAIYYITDPIQKTSASNSKKLYRYDVVTKKATLLIGNVHGFGVEDRFLFTTIQHPKENNSLVLQVSTNQGRTFKSAQVPVVSKNQFYSVLDMSEDMIFIHVDIAGGNVLSVGAVQSLHNQDAASLNCTPDCFSRGEKYSRSTTLPIIKRHILCLENQQGNIYTSDKNGIVYSLSLEHHLFGNLGFNDFYKVSSLPGVFITSQVSANDKVHSRITFDKGGTWQPITSPSGSSCPPTETSCDLHIHNYFSLLAGVNVPSLPLSSSSAVGLILAHGNTGDGLRSRSADVFVSNDGGYTWRQPEQLKGPHYYGIGDSGGILYVVPSKMEPINTLLFSLDEGQCWSPYQFSDMKMLVVGVSAEPGEKATDISIWGWNKGEDEGWLVITIDFKVLLGRLCNAKDYTTWLAHESNSAASTANGCLLGARRTFLRRKKGPVCLNANQLIPTEHADSCPCQRYDYQCDYGYENNEENKCVKSANGSPTQLDICVNGNDEELVTEGYRKIPGDICIGGFSPPRTFEILERKCAETIEPNFHDGILIPQQNNSPVSNGGNGGEIAAVVIVVLLLAALLGILAYRKLPIWWRSGYTSLPTDDNAHPSTIHDSLTEEGDAELIDASSISQPSVSYHDNSDEVSLASS